MTQGSSAVQLCPHDIRTKLVLRDDILLFMLWALNTNLALIFWETSKQQTSFLEIPYSVRFNQLIFFH